MGGGLRSFTVAVDNACSTNRPLPCAPPRNWAFDITSCGWKCRRWKSRRRLRGNTINRTPTAAIPSMAISRLAREHVTVVLNGDGGDEVFAGYRRHLAVRSSPLGQSSPRPSAARCRMAC